MVGEKEKCLQLGMNDYVSKPIKETVLYNIIAQHAQHIPESSSHFEHINLNYLHELSGNDKNFEKEILEQFVVQLPEEVNDLQNAIQTNELDKVRRIAHSLKSTFGYVGLADELFPYLEAMEKDAVAENNTNMSKNFEAVKTKYSEAIKEVKALLSKDLV